MSPKKVYDNEVFNPKSEIVCAGRGELGQDVGKDKEAIQHEPGREIQGDNLHQRHSTSSSP